MKRRITVLLTLAMLLSIFAGCAGTPVVYYSDCTCPAGSHDITPDTKPEPTRPAAEGAVKTGLAIITSLDGTVGAAGGENGLAKYDVTLVAVTVTDEGVIDSCIIDGLGASVNFNAEGLPVDFEPGAAVQTKNELGDNYGMVAWGGAVAEWYQQAAALAEYAKGKTVEELKNGAIDETGHAKDADLATTATIYLGGYVAGIEKAVQNAQHLGAQAGDTLKLATINKLDASAAQEAGGGAQLAVDATALTVRDGVITSCVIDSLQASVEFDGTGAVTTDLTAPVQTKNELGAGYGMVAWGGAIAEWNEQAASFAAYVTGKTAQQVAGIAVTEGRPADADLAASVTIAIGGFQALIAKALS